jgi:type II secretory pathway pseudopilin PulG
MPPPREPSKTPRHGLQLLGSILVALMIVAAVIAVTANRLGSTSVDEAAARTERFEEQAEAVGEATEEARGGADEAHETQGDRDRGSRQHEGRGGSDDRD